MLHTSNMTEAQLGAAMLREARASRKGKPLEVDRTIAGRIMALMIDGRERTGPEIADKLKRFRRHSVFKTLSQLRREGQLTASQISQVRGLPVAYRIAGAAP